MSLMMLQPLMTIRRIQLRPTQKKGIAGMGSSAGHPYLSWALPRATNAPWSIRSHHPSCCGLAETVNQNLCVYIGKRWQTLEYATYGYWNQRNSEQYHGKNGIQQP